MRFLGNVISAQEKILKEANLRQTPVRMRILGLFLDASHALSRVGIEKQLSTNVDRVTLYRTIKTFSQHGILHRIPNEGGTPAYALCGSQCSSAGHAHNHIHFKCTKCGHIRCLEKIDIPPVRLPHGYHAGRAHLIVEGACSDCYRHSG